MWLWGKFPAKARLLEHKAWIEKSNAGKYKKGCLEETPGQPLFEASKNGPARPLLPGDLRPPESRQRMVN
jgi:hypothetical protein